MMKIVSVLCLALAVSTSALALDYHGQGQITGTNSENGCRVSRAEASFEMDSSPEAVGSLTYAGSCAGKKVSAHLKAVDIMADNSDAGGDLAITYAGSGTFDGSSFPMEISIVGKREGRQLSGDALLSFNDMVYELGRFKGKAEKK